MNPCNRFLNNAPHQLEDGWELLHLGIKHGELNEGEIGNFEKYHDMRGIPSIVKNHIWLPRLR